MNLDDTRKFWKKACDFPADKESVYPEHAVAHNFDEQAKGRVLEYGCGGGSDTISLLKRGANVFFVDVVPENVLQTRKRIADEGLHSFGAILEQSDVLPFEEDSLFDSVNCHGVLHHIKEKTMARVIVEFHRVIRPGGVLYAMLYTEHLYARSLRMVERHMKHGMTNEEAFGMCTDGGGTARAYTKDAGCALFETDGMFEVIKAVEYNNGDFRTFWARKP